MENETICRAVEKKVGRPLADAQDFVWISKLIEQQEHQTLGVNTLKRIWGFYGEGDIKSRRGTLDVLAHFLGFRNYATFLMADGSDSRCQERHLLPGQDTGGDVAPPPNRLRLRRQLRHRHTRVRPRRRSG